MSRVILDTHVLLWFDAASLRLSQRVRVLLENADTQVLVSAISAFEIAIKHRLGRLPEAARILEDFDGTLATYGFQHLDFTAAQARLAGALDVAHADPFDRALAAQAIALGTGFVTADRAFDGVEGLEVVW